jgi:hypothetical protein
MRWTVMALLFPKGNFWHGGDVVRRHLAAGLLATAAVLLAGCGSERQVQGSPEPVATSSVADPVADGEAIKATFERYRTEVLAGNGAAVAGIVSPSTITHYGEVVELAQTAGPEEIAGAEVMDRLMIARLRVSMPPEELAAMDGAGLLVYGVDNGMIDASSVETSSLGEVRVEGDRGFAEMVVDSVPSGVDWEFVRAGSDWTFDLAAGFPLINDTLSQVAAENGMSDDEFIFEAATMVTGLPVDASIFNRP